MEIPIIAGIIGLGYYYNQNGKRVKNTSEPKNIYDSKRALKIRRNELKHAEKIWHEPNRIYPGPPKIDPKILFNKVDYDMNQLPIEFTDYRKNDLYTETEVNEVKNKPLDIYNTNSPIAGGWHGISLTGEPIVPGAFRHNNMVPFFGGTVKQNVDDKVHMTTLENFTGQIDNYQQKKEIGPLFPAETNICNPYGAANYTQFAHDRIIPSKIMHNVSPVERIQVGPGLNQGYTSQPSGGFQQANARDYILPKTVDELRIKSNPKLTYYGRILSGMKTALPAKPGKIEKRRPDSFFENTPDRYFTTVGAVTAERQRPNIILKDVNRRTTQLKRRIGSAVPTSGNRRNIRPEVRKSRKVQFKTDGPRHLDATGKWDICQGEYQIVNGKMQLVKEEIAEEQAVEALHDYGKSRTKARETERQTMPINKYRGPLKAGDFNTVRNNQEAKSTKKRFTTHNKHRGHMQHPRRAGNVRDPNDVARTTIKEQTIDNHHQGATVPQQPNKLPVYDTDDVPRTTIKEQTIDNTHEGFMNPESKEGYVNDPDDVPKTTIKEQTIDNTHEGFMNPENKNSYVHDPDDIARTTIKETTIDDGRVGIVSGAEKKSRVGICDPVKTTTKETTLLENVLGSIYRAFGMGYDVTKNEIRNTTRQFTSNSPYTGVAGATTNSKMRSYEDIYNSTVRSLREQVSRGRAPTLSGPKSLNHNVNMTTKKITDIQNKYLNERGLAPTKVYNSIPQPAICGVTKDKTRVPNEPVQDRLDSYVIDQLKTNPYSMRSLAACN